MKKDTRQRYGLPVELFTQIILNVLGKSNNPNDFAEWMVIIGNYLAPSRGPPESELRVRAIMDKLDVEAKKMEIETKKMQIANTNVEALINETRNSTADIVAMVSEAINKRERAREGS